MIEIPKPVPGKGEVLIKVAYCGICGTDYDNYKGDSYFAQSGAVKYPVRFGHEWTGVVTEIGPDVTKFQVGDKVVGDGKVTCEKCDRCLSGRWYDCRNLRSVGTVGNIWPGAMAEYMLMPERNLFKLGSDVDLRGAAAIEPMTIAFNGYRDLDVEGANVLILGTGAIGIAAIPSAHVLGAKKVIIAGRKKSKLDLAKKMGADVTVNTTEQDLKEVVLAETNGIGVDVVIETSGSTSLVEQSIAMTAKMGTIALLGFYDRPLDNMILDSFVLEKKTLRGVSGSRQYFPVVADLVSAGKVDLSPIITQEMSFHEDGERCMEIYESDPANRVKMMVRFD